MQRINIPVIGIRVRCIRDHHAIQRNKSVVAQQRGIVGHTAQRIIVIAHKQEASALLGKFCHLLQFCFGQVHLRAEEDQQICRIRSIRAFLQVLVFYLVLVGFQQVLKVL